MKKVISTFALAITVGAGALAQTAQMKITSKEGDIPVAVVESFKQDFKGASGEWAIVPAQLVGSEYTVSGYNNLDGAAPHAYSVVMKGREINGSAIYDGDGTLLYLKEHISNAALPAAVTNAVLTKYPGYTFMQDQETVKQGKSKLIHYKVYIQKGHDKKELAIDSNGKILKEHDKRA